MAAKKGGRNSRTKSRSRRSKQPPRMKWARSWFDFLAWAEAHDGISWIFRGVRKASYPLIPKIGRPDTRIKGSGYLPSHEQWILDQFKRLAPAYLPPIGQPTTEWDWLALAQHHGLPTRLLDWSFSPLIAAYFATEAEGKEGHSAIFAFSPRYVNRPKMADPFQIHQIVRCDPTHVSPRIIAQSATFTIHPTPTQALQPRVRFQKLIIPSLLCREFKSRLNNFGINRATLFPGLDGIADHLTWENNIINDLNYPHSQILIDVEKTTAELIQTHGPRVVDVVQEELKEARDGGDSSMVKLWTTVLSMVRPRQKKSRRTGRKPTAK